MERRDGTRRWASRFPDAVLVADDGDELRVSYDGRIWRGERPQAQLGYDPVPEPKGTRG